MKTLLIGLTAIIGFTVLSPSANARIEKDEKCLQYVREKVQAKYTKMQRMCIWGMIDPAKWDEGTSVGGGVMNTERIEFERKYELIIKRENGDQCAHYNKTYQFTFIDNSCSSAVIQEFEQK